MARHTASVSKRTLLARFDRFVLDGGTRQLSADGLPIHLTPKAFDLLALLIGEAPRVVTKVEIHRRLWPDSFVSDATLVGLIKDIRRALGDTGSMQMIRTAHRVGYAFTRPLERGPAALSYPGAAPGLLVGDRRIALPTGEHLIGRDEACTVCLQVSSLSRRHARIVVEPRIATIEDLNSKNGTFIAGRRISEPTALRHEDRIQIGGITLTFDAPSSAATTQTLHGRRSGA